MKNLKMASERTSPASSMQLMVMVSRVPLPLSATSVATAFYFTFMPGVMGL